MKTILKLVLLVMASMSASTLFSASTFTKSIGSNLCVINASEHGFSSSKLALRLYDSSAPVSLVSDERPADCQ
jgi:hypothetical protein